eukprot:TRINITY_DN19275_c1_g1_i2.p1 TRINITY_DN19275_c1_g1~~TRINITY_DN19275_c1_g1_i2.p1  ORF type:complete len:464 (+),score=50.85 TRINITY_DN19275_c1_g1_i2:190-1392(+)
METVDVIEGKTAVALCFSATWSTASWRFTLQLIQWYLKDLRGKGLEIVFVSSDTDDVSFTQYATSMPWPAVPFRDHIRREALSKRYKVRGIPALIVLDASGSVIAKDGREAVTCDPTGEDFPWRPKTFFEIMVDARFIRHDSQTFQFVSLPDKVVGLYFSATWCEPCRSFTPRLVQRYTERLKAKGFEIILISSDRDEPSFHTFFNGMPWLALDFQDRKRRDELARLFGVTALPTLVLVGQDGALITNQGCEAMTRDPEGLEFPWYRTAVVDLKHAPNELRTTPTVIAFCEYCQPSVQAAVKQSLTPLAQAYLERQRDSDEDLELAFMIATEAGGVAGRLRELMGLPQVCEQKPLLMLVDITRHAYFYSGPQGEVTEVLVASFVEDYKAKVLTRRQLSHG